MQIPQNLKETVERVSGESGRQWLVTLPALISGCRARWSLELDKPFENLSYHLVLPGRMPDGTEIVLKLGVPCRELLTEAAALNLFAGTGGAVSLLDADAPRGILLMERLTPGTPLYELQGDAEATYIAAALMLRLWRTPPAEHSFPSLAVWFRAFERLREKFDGGRGFLPVELIARAARAFAELNTASDAEMILHGDLHHGNILYSASDGWMAIDPKGICGDPGYEIGSFMLNELPARTSDSVAREILSRRLSIFSDVLQIGRARLAGWAFCHAALSAVWDSARSHPRRVARFAWRE